MTESASRTGTGTRIDIDRYLKKAILPLGFVLWAMPVFSYYYAYHHHEIIPFKSSLLNWGLNLLTLCLLAGVAMAWGRVCLRRIGLSTSSALQSIVFGAAIGYGLLATVGLLLGLIGALNRPMLWAALVALFLGALRELRRLVKDTAASLRRIELSGLLRRDFDSLLRVCLLAFLAMGLLLASVPPTSWDALVVHLVIPQNALRYGAISAANEHAQIFSLRPIFLHMLFTLGMGLRGDILPKLIHFSFGVLTVLAVYAMARDHFRCSPLLAASVFYLTPVVQLIAPWAYVDLGVTFYTTVTVYALLSWLRSDNDRWLLISAVCGAWAGQVKSNGYFVVAFAVALLLFQLLRSRRVWQERLALVAQFALAAMLMSGPWMAANGMLQAPALGQVQQGLTHLVSGTDESVPTDSVQGEDEVRASQPEASSTAAGRLAAVGALPWSMTMKGFEGRYEFDGELGPLFLMLLPVWPFLWREKNSRVAMLCVAVMCVLWLGRLQGARLQNRLLMPAFPLLSIMTACGMERIREWRAPFLSPYAFTRLVFALVFVIAVANQVILTSLFSPCTFLFGGRGRDAYLTYVFDTFYPNSPGYYSAVQHAASVLPADAKLGLLWPEKRTYYLPVSYEAQPFPLNATAESMWEKSQALGLTHLLVHRSGLDFSLHRSDDVRLDRKAIATYVEELDELLADHGVLLTSEDTDYELYQLVKG